MERAYATIVTFQTASGMTGISSGYPTLMERVAVAKVRPMGVFTPPLLNSSFEANSGNCIGISSKYPCYHLTLDLNF